MMEYKLTGSYYTEQHYLSDILDIPEYLVNNVKARGRTATTPGLFSPTIKAVILVVLAAVEGIIESFCFHVQALAREYR